MLKSIAVLPLLFAASAFAEPAKLHVSTDIVTWDKPMTEAQCLEKGKAAIVAADSSLATVTATHAWVGTKDSWVVSVDCLQSYKLNGAYVTVIYNGAKVDDYTKVKTALSKGLGGKSEMIK